MSATRPIDHRRFFELSQDPLCVLDRDGRFLDVNPALERALGLSAEELLSRSFLEIIHEDDLAAARVLWRELLTPSADGRPRRLNGSLRCRGGGGAATSRWLAWSLADSTPKDALIVATARDVTSPHEGSQRLKALLDAAPDFVGMSTHTGEMLYINPAGLALVGRAGQDPTSIRHRELVPPKEYEHLAKDLLPALLAEGIMSAETWFLHADGTEIPVERIFVRLWDERGQPDGFGTIAIDVREKRRSEADMTRLKALIDATPDIVSLSDAYGNILYMNPAGLAMLGLPPEALRRRPISWRDLTPQEDIDRFHRDVLPPLLERGVATSEQELTHASGARIPVSLAYTMLRDEHGAMETVASIARDLTEHKRLAASLMEAIRALGAPILPIDDGVLAMPVIGRVDQERAGRMMESLLRAVVRSRCRVAILDLTGVAEVDAATAAHLGRMIGAAALLGARCFVSGVAPSAAPALLELYRSGGGLSTFGTLAEAHRAAERLLRGSPRAARARRGGP